MQTTTPGTIRAALITAIKAIVPTHAEHRDKMFRMVRSVDDIPGPTLRNFHVDIGAGQPIEDGIYGSGVEYKIDVAVYVGYGALAPEDDDSIITEDGAQIWRALQALYDPALPGLISVEPTPFVDGITDAGHRWGAFAFDIRYLHNV